MKNPAWAAERAEQHMAGNITDSPFVSVALKSENIPVSDCDWVKTIATGKPGYPGAARAPHIATFEVPSSRLIGPRNPLSQSETERAFVGEDLKDFMISWMRNPY